MDIKVSVIMAVYNSERYLRQAIDSVVSQTLKDIEIILVDDGSSDNSLSILHEYEKRDSRIRVLVNTEESDGAAMARNIGVSHAKGNYISVLDADDFFEPDMLEKAYNLAESEKADAVIFDGYRYDDLNKVDLERNTILFRDKLLPDKAVFSPEENADNLFSMTLGAAWNAIFKKEHIDKYGLRFQSFHHADDLEFVYLNFALAERIVILPERLIHYRVNNSGSQASMISRWPDTAWQAMLSFKNKLVEYGLYEKYRTAYIRKAMQYIMFYLDNMNTAEGFDKLYKALQNGKLSELDLADASETEICDTYLTAVRDMVINISPEQYIFKKLCKEHPFDRAIAWKKKIPAKSHLILYGADRMGVEVFHSILWAQDYVVAAWVDKQYKELGYPVKSPDVVFKELYDYILITSASKKNYEVTRNELIKQGVEAERIRWIFDE